MQVFFLSLITFNLGDFLDVHSKYVPYSKFEIQQTSNSFDYHTLNAFTSQGVYKRQLANEKLFNPHISNSCNCTRENFQQNDIFLPSTAIW